MQERSLRGLREGRTWTREEVAVRANLSASYVTMIELGQREPSLKVLRRLADAFGVSLAEIVALLPRVEAS